MTLNANAMKNPKANAQPGAGANPRAVSANQAVRPGTALKLDGSKGGLPLSAAQQRFNRLLEKIGKLEAQVTQMQALADAFRPLYQRTLEPLRKAHQDAMRRTALCLDERLSRKGLTPAQQRHGVEILCDLCKNLASLGDKTMAALHDQHSPRSLRQKEEDRADLVRAMVESALGQPLDLPSHGASPDPLQAVLRASRERLHEAMQAEQAQQAARKKKKPTPAQVKAGQAQADADTVLRQVYRQLASALHPDRERDPAEQQRKTAWMSEANAAYARQDLVALLHLQLRFVQAEARDLLRLPEERIAAMRLLLKQQAAELENELLLRKQHLKDAFDLDYDQSPTAAMLQRQLDRAVHCMKEMQARMETDIAQLQQQDEAGFKRWLKAQVKLRRAPDFF